jgi:hypothetical protein
VLTGVPEVGQTLSVAPGTYEPADATPTYTWMRNGTAISGGTNVSYVCGPDDLGAQLSVQVDLNKPDMQGASHLLAAPAAVTAAVVVAIRAIGQAGAARVRVRVSPVGLDVPPPGRVVVRLRKREVIANLVDGRAVVRFARLRPGTARVEASYLGSGPFKPSAAVGEVALG